MTGFPMAGPLRLAVALAACGAAPLPAETVPHCRTTAGEEGLLFRGTYALIQSPVAFADVRTGAGTGLKVIPELRDGPGVLAEVGSTLAADPGSDAAGSATVVEFLGAGGRVVHRCGVEVVAFDPERHDPARLQAGDCALTLVAGRPQLMAGHAQVVAFPRYLSEAAPGNPLVADLSTLSARRLYLLGKSPGVTVLLWTFEGPGGSVSVNICPLEVSSPGEASGAEGPKDGGLCRDASGAPMRLAVGQTAVMAFRDTEGEGRAYHEAAVADPAVADFAFAKGGGSAAVTGVAPGSTSITLLTHDAAVATNCEIVVE